MEYWKHKKSVISNLGVAFLPEFTVLDEIKTGQIIKLDTNIKENNLISVYSYNKKNKLNKQTKIFLDLLSKI